MERGRKERKAKKIVRIIDESDWKRKGALGSDREKSELEDAKSTW